MKISNSQFADTCDIPRPTVTLLLKGRNKKISDEIIAKIHNTYPSLSIMWLLFGEGSMMSQENAEFSEGLEEENPDNFANYHDVNQSISNFETPQNSVRNFESNRKNNPFPSVFDNDGLNQLGKIDLSAIEPERSDSDAFINEGKRITNIVVFYSDNSFQSFKPSDN